jgi:hypothetical protein
MATRSLSGLLALVVSCCCLCRATRTAPPATLKYLSWFGADFYDYSRYNHSAPALPITGAHANLIKSAVLSNISRTWTCCGTPGLLNLEACVCGGAGMQPCGTSHAACKRLISRDRRSLTPYWRSYAAEIVSAVAPYAPSAPPPLGGAVAGLMLGDELVMSGLPLSNLTALADTLAAALRPLGVFITTNEGLHWGTKCNSSSQCDRPSGAGPQACAAVDASVPSLPDWPLPGNHGR